MLSEMSHIKLSIKFMEFLFIVYYNIYSVMSCVSVFQPFVLIYNHRGRGLEFHQLDMTLLYPLTNTTDALSYPLNSRESTEPLDIKTS